MSDIITIQDFCERHDAFATTIYVRKTKGHINPSAFSLNCEGVVMISESFFIRRKAFQKKIWLESHDFYYFLTKHMNEADLCRMLHKKLNKFNYHST